LRVEQGRGTVVKSVAFGVVAIAALIGTPAFAADGVFPPPSLPPQGWSFTGCYIGANGGAAWGNSNFNWTNIIEKPPLGFSTGAATALPEAADASLDRGGFIGGGQAGCNYQPGWLVVGIEGDFGYTNLGVGRSTTSSPFNNDAGALTLVPGNISESFSSDWLSTIRGRLGIASGAWLYYATAGLAIAKASFSDQVCFSPPAQPTCNTASSTGTREGWVAGGGIEWKLTPAFSAKLEYLFADFGNIASTSIAMTAAGATPYPEATITHDHTFNESIIRIGVNYQFIWGAK
jgi:outer membrane immunogenic protein